MSIIELGALGEFLGSIGVIATLIYLAIQIRQNTHSLDEDRRLAMAQTYQQRATTITEGTQWNARTGLSIAATQAQTDGLASLSDDDRTRVADLHAGNMFWFDNLFFQYQNGFLDEEYYESLFKKGVRRNAPFWRELNLPLGRPSFLEEVDRILAESEENEQ